MAAARAAILGVTTPGTAAVKKAHGALAAAVAKVGRGVDAGLNRISMILSIACNRA